MGGAVEGAEGDEPAQLEAPQRGPGECYWFGVEGVVGVGEIERFVVEAVDPEVAALGHYEGFAEEEGLGGGGVLGALGGGCCGAGG